MLQIQDFFELGKHLQIRNEYMMSCLGDKTRLNMKFIHVPRTPYVHGPRAILCNIFNNFVHQGLYCTWECPSSLGAACTV